MAWKLDIFAFGAVIGILLISILAMVVENTSLTGAFSYEKSIDNSISNCIGLRIQCRKCLYTPYNFNGRQLCNQLCERYFERCYEKSLPTTPLVRG